MMGFAAPRMAKAGGPAAGAWLGVGKDAATKYFMPVAILVALSGVLLVTTNDAWEWGHAFVWLGLAIVALALLIGLVVNKPATDRALKAAGEGDIPAAQANAQRAGIGGVVILLLLIVAEILMVTRFGTG